MEELTLERFLEMAQEYGVQRLTAGAFSVEFPPRAPGASEVVTVPHEPQPGLMPNHPRLWGPKGPPTFNGPKV